MSSPTRNVDVVEVQATRHVDLVEVHAPRYALTEVLTPKWPDNNAVIELFVPGPLGPRGEQGVQGVQGAQGVQGVEGPPGALFEQSFAAASTVWFIEHNMDTYPVVTTVDLNNEEIQGDVVHPDKNHVVITFLVPFAGTARLKA